MYYIPKAVIIYYVMRSKNGVLCAAAGSLAMNQPKHHIKPFLPRITYTFIHIFFLQTFIIITNYLRNVKKPDRRLGRLIN
jgi:hypothetical protein